MEPNTPAVALLSLIKSHGRHNPDNGLISLVDLLRVMCNCIPVENAYFPGSLGHEGPAFIVDIDRCLSLIRSIPPGHHDMVDRFTRTFYPVRHVDDFKSEKIECDTDEEIDVEVEYDAEVETECDEESYVGD